VAVQSLTNEPVSISSRLLVTHVAQEKGFGKGLKIEGVDVEIWVRTSLKNPKVYELDRHGNRRKEIATRRSSGWLIFQVNPTEPSLNTEIVDTGK
jgi:hypothetical protein